MIRPPAPATLLFSDLEKLLILAKIKQDPDDQSFIADLQNIYAKTTFEQATLHWNKLDWLIAKEILSTEDYNRLQNMAIKILKQEIKALKRALKQKMNTLR